jgi:hypothetical protein
MVNKSSSEFLKVFAARMSQHELELTLQSLADQIGWDEMQARTIPEEERVNRTKMRDAIANELADRALLIDSDSPTESNSSCNND